MHSELVGGSDSQTAVEESVREEEEHPLLVSVPALALLVQRPLPHQSPVLALQVLHS